MRILFILFVIVAMISCERRRPQEPREPYPYESNEVNLTALDGINELVGTLTRPANDSLKMGVILINGSGPHGRDYENQFGHRPFLVLTDYLTRQGITVLRYDERGVGKSKGNYKDATYENLVSDAAGGARYLAENGCKKVGIIGHSEGGGMALAVALLTKTDFLVLMAPDNSTADESLLYQTSARLKRMGATQEISKKMLATLDSLLKIVKAEPDHDVARFKMNNLIAQVDRQASPEYKGIARRMGDPDRLIQGFLDPKFMYRLNNDPKQTLAKIRLPVLVMYGDQDTSVDVPTNLPLIEKALDSTKHEIKVFPDLGHLFMNAKGADLAEVEETIAPEVLDTIKEWILSN